MTIHFFAGWNFVGPGVVIARAGGEEMDLMPEAAHVVREVADQGFRSADHAGFGKTGSYKCEFHFPGSASRRLGLLI
jgi:hypothetical protein